MGRFGCFGTQGICFVNAMDLPGGAAISDRESVVQLFRGPGQPFRLQRHPLPERLEDGQVLVRISLATICGSDLHTVDGRRSCPVPSVLGHEAVGIVEASARPEVTVGQRVTWSLVDSCGRCTACSRWRLPQKCQRLFKYGHAAADDDHGLNGCYATHIVLRAGTPIVLVPDGLSDAMVAPANCALATIANCLSVLPVPCDRVLVQGPPVGDLRLRWLRRLGVTEVYCADIDPGRLAVAEQFGARPVSVEQSPGDIDLVLEVAGTAAVIPAGVAALRPGGHYMLAGMVHPATDLSGLTGQQVIAKCLTIRGVHNYAAEHLTQAIDFLSQQRDVWPWEQLTSPPLELSRLDEAFQLARARQWPRVAVRA